MSAKAGDLLLELERIATDVQGAGCALGKFVTGDKPTSAGKEDAMLYMLEDVLVDDAARLWEIAAELQKLIGRPA